MTFFPEELELAKRIEDQDLRQCHAQQRQEARDIVVDSDILGPLRISLPLSV